MPFVEALPSSILLHVVCFLQLQDSMKLARCSKSLHDSISLTCLQVPKELGPFIRHGGVWDGMEFVKLCRLPVWMMPRAHSLILSCQWRDQGWGNRKSRLAVVAFPSTAFQQDIIPPRITGKSLPWGGGRLVYLSPTDAPHQLVPLRVTLPITRPKENEGYVLFARAGNGGGHSVEIRDISLRSVIFDEEDRTVSKVFQALHRVGFFASPSPPSVSNDQSSMHATIVARLQSSGYFPDSKSVQSLEEISEWLVAEHRMDLRS